MYYCPTLISDADLDGQPFEELLESESIQHTEFYATMSGTLEPDGTFDANGGGDLSGETCSECETDLHWDADEHWMSNIANEASRYSTVRACTECEPTTYWHSEDAYIDHSEAMHGEEDEDEDEDEAPARPASIAIQFSNLFPQGEVIIEGINRTPFNGTDVIAAIAPQYHSRVNATWPYPEQVLNYLRSFGTPARSHMIMHNVENHRVYMIDVRNMRDYNEYQAPTWEFLVWPPVSRGDSLHALWGQPVREPVAATTSEE